MLSILNYIFYNLAFYLMIIGNLDIKSKPWSINKRILSAETKFHINFSDLSSIADGLQADWLWS